MKSKAREETPEGLILKTHTVYSIVYKCALLNIFLGRKMNGWEADFTEHHQIYFLPKFIFFAFQKMYVQCLVTRQSWQISFGIVFSAEEMGVCINKQFHTQISIHYGNHCLKIQHILKILHRPQRLKTINRRAHLVPLLPG